MALVSIIVPVYNVEQYLEQCLNSILGQSLTDIEVVLVDDGSTDSSGEICERFAHLDDRIRCIHKPNGGLSEARNAGIAIATADYLAFVDADDWISPEMMEQLYLGCVENDAEISCCGRFYEYPGYNYPQYTIEDKEVYTQDEALRHMLRGDTIDVACWDKMFARRLFEKYRFPANEIHEDMAILFDLFLEVERIVHVGSAYYHYRQRAMSITKQKFTVKSLVILKHIKRVRAMLQVRSTLKAPADAFYFRMLKNTCTIYLNSNGETNLHKEFAAMRAELRENLATILFNRELRLVEKLSVIAVLSPFYSVIKSRFLAVAHRLKRKTVSHEI